MRERARCCANFPPLQWIQWTARPRCGFYLEASLNTSECTSEAVRAHTRNKNRHATSCLALHNSKLLLMHLKRFTPLYHCNLANKLRSVSSGCFHCLSECDAMWSVRIRVKSVSPSWCRAPLDPHDQILNTV